MSKKLVRMKEKGRKPPHSKGGCKETQLGGRKKQKWKEHRIKTAGGNGLPYTSAQRQRRRSVAQQEKKEQIKIDKGK